MKNNIIAFLIGILTACVVYLKNKSPDVINVDGDNIEEQKVKDNRKIKNRKTEVSSYSDSALISSDMKRREVIKIWKGLAK